MTNVSVILITWVKTPAGPAVCGISAVTLATHQHATLHLQKRQRLELFLL